jgi:DNA-directed RNA polymerase specialized sigma subunit
MSRDVSRALKQAIEELSADDRLLLKLYYFDDIKLKDLGQMFGYHEATASRKLMRIQTEIRKSVERILSSEHNWSESEVARCLTETASKLGISLEKMISILIVFVFVQEALGGTVL